MVAIEIQTPFEIRIQPSEFQIAIGIRASTLYLFNENDFCL